MTIHVTDASNIRRVSSCRMDEAIPFALNPRRNPASLCGRGDNQRLWCREGGWEGGPPDVLDGFLKAEGGLVGGEKIIGRVSRAGPGFSRVGGSKGVKPTRKGRRVVLLVHGDRAGAFGVEAEAQKLNGWGRKLDCGKKSPCFASVRGTQQIKPQGAGIRCAVEDGPNLSSPNGGAGVDPFGILKRRQGEGFPMFVRVSHNKWRAISLRAVATIGENQGSGDNLRIDELEVRSEIGRD